MKTLTITIMVLIGWSCNLVNSYNVLMILPAGRRSHKNVFDPIAEALAQKGHQVTIMAPLKETAEVKGVRNVHLKEVDRIFLSQDLNFFEGTVDDADFVTLVVNRMVAICNATFHEPEVLDIIKAGRGSKKYDVVLADQSLSDHLLALGHLMGVPNIYLSTFFLLPSVAWTLNIPSPYSYVPVGFHVVGEPMNFMERAKNVMDHIPDSPPLLEIERNVSLVLINTNPAIHPRRPSVPYVIEVGCLHCRAPKALPKDLEDFIQESKDHGVIYFSLGSMTKGAYMPEDMKTKVIEVFGRISQKVLWTYEGDIPDLPKNVKLIKWAPQQDILGHPKVRLFISHGGGLSTLEAPFHGCPILGFPLSGDQLGNIANAVRLGYAEILDWKTFTAEELLDTVRKMLEDPKEVLVSSSSSIGLCLSLTIFAAQVQRDSD